MSTLFTRDDIATAYAAFQEATQVHVAVEDNLADVRQTFNELVERASLHGSFIVDVQVLKQDALWTMVNTKAGNDAKNLLRDCANGQVAMPHEEWLDRVVTVGENRRTLVRDLVRTDIERMLAVRKVNRDKAVEAYQTARRGAAVLNDALDAGGNLANALIAGMLPVKFAEPREMSA